MAMHGSASIYSKEEWHMKKWITLSLVLLMVVGVVFGAMAEDL